MKTLHLVALLVLLIIPQPSRTQILYTDIDPDTTMAAPQNMGAIGYFIDLDRSGTPEFRLELFQPAPDFRMLDFYILNASCGNEVLIVPGRPPAVLQFGEKIDATTTGEWDNKEAAFHLTMSDVPGLGWDNVSDGYLGLRIYRNGKWLYGWLRLGVAALSMSYTLKEFALEQKPGRPILAGDRGITAVDFPSASEYKVNVYSTGMKVVVELPQGKDACSTLDMYTVLGAHAGHFALSGECNTVPMPHAPRGTYIAVVWDGESIHARTVSLW